MELRNLELYHEELETTLYVCIENNCLNVHIVYYVVKFPRGYEVPIEIKSVEK